MFVRRFAHLCELRMTEGQRSQPGRDRRSTPAARKRFRIVFGLTSTVAAIAARLSPCRYRSATSATSTWSAPGLGRCGARSVTPAASSHCRAVSYTTPNSDATPEMLPARRYALWSSRFVGRPGIQSKVPAARIGAGPLRYNRFIRAGRIIARCLRHARTEHDRGGPADQRPGGFNDSGRADDRSDRARRPSYTRSRPEGS